jgi:hypothetical protein
MLIFKEKKKMIRVYNMFPRIESILFLKDTSILVEQLSNQQDTKDRCDSLAKQNFKEIQLIGINRDVRVFIEIIKF